MSPSVSVSVLDWLLFQEIVYSNGISSVGMDIPPLLHDRPGVVTSSALLPAVRLVSVDVHVKVSASVQLIVCGVFFNPGE